jgi:hypothetical protein
VKTINDLAVIEELDPESIARVAGGMINLYDGPRPHPPIDPGHGGLDQPYGESNDSLRFGAGPWGSGYGSPTGPWPV